jgi:hypothetical protein
MFWSLLRWAAVLPLEIVPLVMVGLRRYPTPELSKYKNFILQDILHISIEALSLLFRLNNSGYIIQLGRQGPP